MGGRRITVREVKIVWGKIGTSPGDIRLQRCDWHARRENSRESHSRLVSFHATCGRDSIGDASIAGDLRWSGAFGVNVDMVARSHCSVEMILLDDLQVLLGTSTQCEIVIGILGLRLASTQS